MPDSDRRKMTRRTDNDDATRTQCYAEIRNCMKTRLLAYYQKHKELIGDERSQRAIHESTEGLSCIFDILDLYTIEPKGPTP